MAMLWFVIQRGAFYTHVVFSLFMLSRSERLWSSSVGRQQVVKPEPLPDVWPHILVLTSDEKGDQRTN